MNHTEFSWQQEGTDVYAQGWAPENPKAVIGIVHGMGEHSGRYEQTAKTYNSKGYAVYAFDHFGHGKTKSQRGFVKDYDHLLNSVDALLKSCKEKHPDLPVFLYGHSMGGNVLVNFLLRRQPGIKGAVLTSPWFKMAFEPPKGQLLLGKIMRTLKPNYSDRSKLDASKISRDPAEVKKYVDDSLVHDYVTPAFFFPVFQSGIWALDNATKLSVPTLVTHGTGDGLISYKASGQFAKNAGDNATYKQWEGGYHELHHDTIQDEFKAFVADWMDNQINF